ncbi:heparinase II/III domain-containing protein [Marinobacterium aestuariivivens]|uniref:Heparinase II/III family protein n=1 Tax=Marinobacterium aestuariivivens TaxID=1698799 RepID=A0ABW1ZTN5_9GAMM
MKDKASRIDFVLKKIEVFESEGFRCIGRDDLEPYKIETPFNWSLDPFVDNNWKFQLHTLRYLMIYLDAFLLTEERGYADKLLDYLEDWYSCSENNGNDFAWHDMATGIRAEKIYLIFTKLRPYKIHRPEKLKKIIKAHVERMMSEGYVNLRHNHGLYVIHGLRCLAEVVGPKKKLQIKSFCGDKFACLIKDQFDENFVHKEHSPHYHHLVLDTLKRYEKTGLYSDYEFLSATIKEAEANSSFLYLPDGRELPFGDTDFKECKGISSLSSLESSPCYSDIFLKSGYFVCREEGEGGSYLSVINNFNSNIHKHADNLSFVWGECGQDIVVDPGKYKYCNDDIRKYVTTSMAHNVVNFKDFQWGVSNLEKPVGKIHYRFFDEETIEADSEVAIKLNGSVYIFQRTFFYRQKAFLVVVDRILNSGDETYIARFNLDKSAELIKNKDGVIKLEFNGVRVSFQAKTLSHNLDFEDLSSNSLELLPVSYAYGEFDRTLSITSEFKNNIISFFQIGCSESAVDFVQENKHKIF